MLVRFTSNVITDFKSVFQVLVTSLVGLLEAANGHYFYLYRYLHRIVVRADSI